MTPPQGRGQPIYSRYIVECFRLHVPVLREDMI